MKDAYFPAQIRSTSKGIGFFNFARMCCLPYRTIYIHATKRKTRGCIRFVIGMGTQKIAVRSARKGETVDLFIKCDCGSVFRLFFTFADNTTPPACTDHLSTKCNRFVHNHQTGKVYSFRPVETDY